MDTLDPELACLLTPMVLRRPELLTTSTWLGHIPFAFWLMEALQPRVFVELGTYAGASYCAFCQAVRELQLTTSCFAVDTWQGDEHTGYYGQVVYNRLARHHEPRYGSFSRLLRTTFDEAALQFADAGIDLLHIDGLHTYEAVRHDFTHWQPKLSDRAVVLFHDTAVRERDYGVWRLWQEISAAYPSLEFLHASGLGVAAVGPAIPEPVRWLVEVPRRRPHLLPLIQAYFARLGQAVERDYDLHQQGRQLQHFLDWLGQTVRYRWLRHTGRLPQSPHSSRPPRAGGRQTLAGR